MTKAELEVNAHTMLFLVNSNRALPKIACSALNYCQIRVVTARTGVSKSLLLAPSRCRLLELILYHST